MPKRPFAITIIAWIFIAVGTGGILKDLWPLLTSHAREQIAMFRTEGLREIVPAWTVRLSGVIGGAFLLRGANWARWLLVAWMAFHLGLSVLHDLTEVLVHVAFFVPILFFLFRPQVAGFFREGSS